MMALESRQMRTHTIYQLMWKSLGILKVM